MHGHINCIVREMVRSKFGTETWEQVLERTHLDDNDDFLMFNYYSDATTMNLLHTAADITRMPMDVILKFLGNYFFVYFLNHGYDKMLMTLGGDIPSFIRNLPSLHYLVGMTFELTRAPSFSCQDNEDGTMTLHYYSRRKGLFPIVIGLMEIIGQELFDSRVTLTIREQNEIAMADGTTLSHTAFVVHVGLSSPVDNFLCPAPEASLGSGSFHELDHWRRRSGSLSMDFDLRRKAYLKRRRSSGSLFAPMNVVASDLCTAFPYHILFDRDLIVRQVGVSLQTLMNAELRDNMRLEDMVTVVQPYTDLTIESFMEMKNCVFVLSIDRVDEATPLLLRGQVTHLKKSKLYMFIGSPKLASLTDLMDMNMYLADIPLFDLTRELVVSNQMRMTEFNVAKALDEASAKLRKTSQALSEEKHKADSLVCQLMPRKIVKQLTRGETVKAEKHQDVTVLFGQIVNINHFIEICSPIDVVVMLNNLYERYDSWLRTHDVYMVASRINAYMVVAGVPEHQPDHAKQVADFAMDMLESCRMVMSPATGEPLQILIGISSGPVVSGIVGNKKPHYDVFGDTVNVASRMTSYGAPNRIHTSDSTYAELLPYGFCFKRRGEIDIKGKGKMTTFFIGGRIARRLSEPPDEFTPLPLEEHDCEIESLSRVMSSESVIDVPDILL